MPDRLVRRAPRLGQRALAAGLTAAATLAHAEGAVALHMAASVGGSAAPGLTRERLRWERLERTLRDRTLVLAPSTVTIWLGDTPLPPLTAPH